MGRVYNFSAGPGVLPESVLKKAAAEILDYKGSGMSIMEMSHRSSIFQSVIDETEAILRDIMNIPSNYKVLFLQGGASQQFAMVPLNFFTKTKKADFVKTGNWAKKAIEQAQKYGKVSVVADSSDKNFSYFPKLDASKFDTTADFFHITTNNTIEGTKISDNKLPNTGNVPLVADMSSNILSEVYDVKKFGLIYAGAQKNMATAGLTVVIIREDLIGKPMDITPIMLDYKTHVENGSMYNTPPCWCIYIAKLVFEWIKDIGGVKAMEKINKEKASLFYKAVDNSKLFKTPVTNPDDRSLMTIPFTLPNDELNKKFLKFAEDNKCTTLEGHRSVGGMRASMYNAMPMEGVKKLISLIEEFDKKNS